MSLVCVPAPEENANGQVSWAMENGTVSIRCIGLRNALGSAIEPMKFGDVDGNKPLYFQLVHYYTGNVNLIHFFILIGAPPNG
jgi:hypothetical protein